MVPPSEFIPLAEHTGLIKQLSADVLDAALRQLRGWLGAGLDLGVAVNLSARNLLEADLPDQIADLLLRRGVPVERLVLEITESTIMADPERTFAVLALGCDYAQGWYLGKPMPASELAKWMADQAATPPAGVDELRSSSEPGANHGDAATSG